MATVDPSDSRLPKSAVTETSSAVFSGDQPIKSLSSDLLNRHEFAFAIANAIASWNGDTSLTLALYGAWGSGKTSIKNLILEKLRKDEPVLTYMEFNPWAWSGQDAMFAAFFREVGIALGSKAKGEAGKDTKRNWNKYASRLMLGSTTLKYLKLGSQLVGVPVLPFALGLAEQAAQGTSELLKQADEAENAEDEETLEDLKQSLSSSLAALDKPLLVVLDDIDRLSSEEIKLLFRLLKANVDFPKTIFLLLFDRSVVEKALADMTGQDGRAYMEKIIQAGFDLPVITHEEILESLANGLDKLFSVRPKPPTIDQDRWAVIFHRGIGPIFENMRDVVRFLSSLSFVVGMFDKEGVFEVDVVDLTALEVLRMFEPNLYRSLYRSKALLLTERSRIYGNYGEQDKIRKEKFEELVKLARISSRPAARKMLEELFPAVHQNCLGFEGIWLRSLRVCSEKLFDRYFVLSVPKDDVSQLIIEEIRRALPSVEELRAIFERLVLEEKLDKVLERLVSFAETFGVSSAENLVTAMWDVGDALRTKPSPFFSFGPAMTGIQMVSQLLKGEKSVETRSAILLASMRNSTGLSFPFKLVHLESEQETKPGEADYFLDLSSLQVAKQLMVDKIRVLASAGKLVGENLSLYLPAWSDWGSAVEMKAYTQGLSESQEGALLLLQGFVYDQRPTNLNSGVTRSHHVLRLDELARYVSIDQLTMTLGPLMTEEVTEENANLIAQFGTELEAFKAALGGYKVAEPDDEDEDGGTTSADEKLC